jgi:hypothetical protein
LLYFPIVTMRQIDMILGHIFGVLISAMRAVVLK